ncbi:TIGR02186 family protein [Hyphococcus flavus]|uniref:TIGR02186 family protein n=1 Tax=Hyphococcus flavus TaxID=1866326 RepID=A0AAF0CB92_9PROT|nr:TIGR02186 family protein [Hyphococcus flavus]WDI30310.1 TIGR02186 family protein [Hyphococcus flavus]
MKTWLILLAAFALIAPSNAADIEVAFTDDRVEVDTGFSGARMTLFGAVTGIENHAEAIDIVSVIRGPDARFEIRRMEKSNLIWTPGDAQVVTGAPGLYHTYATRDVNDIAPLPVQAANRLNPAFLDVLLTPKQSPENNIGQEISNEFRDAFFEEAAALDLYRARTSGIQFKKGALFTVNVDLPANTPVGDYAVSIFLFQDGEILASDIATLAVNKVGAERRIYEFAHNRPVSYGLFCVFLSLLAGWAASLAFRK